MKTKAPVIAILAALVACLHTTVSADTAPPPDAGLYTQYNLDPAQTVVNWSTCGSLGTDEGCYGAGTLGPFGKVGALLEGTPAVNGNTVTRALYILDLAAGPRANRVTLSVYTKTDSIQNEFDTVTINLFHVVNLPLTGGATATASMAANALNLFIGTNQTTNAVRVDKHRFSVSSFTEVAPPTRVSSITANEYGYVTVTWGSFRERNASFIILGPDGYSQGDGGGSEFLLNTLQAVLPDTIP